MGRIRYSVVKSCNNWILLGRSYLYKDLPKDESIFNIIKDLPHLGLLYGLKADFFIIYNKSDISMLEDYDVIIKLDSLPEINPRSFPDILICYQAGEPFLRNVNPETYNVLLDNFITEYDNVSLESNHIPWTYRYPVDLMRKYLSVKSNLPIVFVQKNTILENEPINARGEAFGIRSFPSYLKYLSECKYLFNLNNNESAGQIIAEAAILDVISFANPIKPLQRLLYPEICYATNEKELWLLYNKFEEDHSLYENVIDLVRKNLCRVDCKDLDKIFKSKIIDQLEV